MIYTMDTGEMGNLKRIKKRVEAVVLWLEENRASIVPITHVLAPSDRMEGKTTQVKWRKTKSYPAKILKISDEKEVLQDYMADCLIGMGHDKINTTISPEKSAKKRPSAERPSAEGHSAAEAKQRKLNSDQRVSPDEKVKETANKSRNSLQAFKEIDLSKPANVKTTGVSRGRSRVYAPAPRYMNSTKLIDGAKELSITLSPDEDQILPIPLPRKQTEVSSDVKARKSEIESSAAKTPVQVASVSSQRSVLSQCRGDQLGATPPSSLALPLADRQANQIKAHVQKEHENQALIAKLRKEIAAKSQTISHLEEALQQEQNHSSQLESTIKELRASTIPDVDATPENVKFLDKLSGILKQKLKDTDFHKSKSKRSLDYVVEKFAARSSPEEVQSNPVRQRDRRGRTNSTEKDL